MQRRWMAALTGLGFSLLLSASALAASPYEGDPAPTCSTDSECAEGEICDYGYCGPKGDSCLSDEDCGAYTFCEFNGDSVTIGSGEVPPNETEPEAGSGSDSGDDGGSSDQAAPEAQPIARGECVADPETIPEDTVCRSICDRVAECIEAGSTGGSEPTPVPSPDTPSEGSGGDSGGASDGGPPVPGGSPAPSEDGDDRDPNDNGDSGDSAEVPDERPAPTDEQRAAVSRMCTLLCSYSAVTQPESADELAALDSCLSGVTGCEGVTSDCQAELEAADDVFEDGPDAPDAYDDGLWSEDGGTNTEAPADSRAGAQTGDSGCAGAPTPGTGWLMLFGLLAWLAVRPRVRA